ncbi:MAG: autotransporter domain-containing protein [Gammaproteobacteria bacterium]|jgi:outer membrane autotransporter protein|nr:autotransporter domain-containing protein [Gammaproteobacteria bacterium]
MKAKGRTFLTRAVLASSVFCLFPLTAQAVLTNIIVTPDSTATLLDPPSNGAGGVGGYAFTLTNSVFTVTNNYIVGQTGAVSFDNTANKAGIILNFDGNSTVQGETGAVNPLDTINVNGSSGTTVFFQNDVNAANLNVTAGGTAQFKTAVITADIDNTGASNTGTLIFNDTNTVNGSIGATNPFNLITAQNTLGAAYTLIFDSPVVNATTINLLDGGVGNATTLRLDNAAMVLTGNITNKTNDLNILNILNATTINGNLGTSDAVFNKIMVGANVNTTINGNIFVGAAGVQFQANNKLSIGSGFNINGPVTTIANGAGILNFLGNSTITSQIGAGGAALALVGISGPAGTVVNLQNNIFADVLVGNGGTLAVTGARTITGDFDVQPGVLSLGANSPLTVTGAFSMNAASTLQIDMAGSSTTTSKVAVAGNATTNTATTINILNAGYSPTPVTNTIITSGAAGNYGAPTPLVTSNSLLTQFITQVNGQNLELVSLSQAVAANTNQSNTVGVASALDAIARSGQPVGGLLGNVINSLGLFTSQAQLTEALAELAPNVSGANMYESFMLQRKTSDAVGDRLDNLNQHLHASNSYASGYAAGDRNAPCYGSWVRLFGQTADQDRRDNIDGYTDDMWGIAGGFDLMTSENALVGIALSWANADIRYDIAGGGDSDIDSYQAALYGDYHFSNPLFLHWFGAVAYNDYHNERNVNFANLFFSPTGDTHAWQYGAKAELGYIFGEQALKTIPMVSLYYSHLDMKSYTEIGANTANQTIDDEGFDILQGGLGIKFAYDCPHGRTLYQPELHLNAFYDFIGDRFETTSQFVGSGPSFTTSGFKPAQDSYNIGASVSIFGDNNVTLTASYDFDFKDDYTANSGFLRLRYGW